MTGRKRLAQAPFMLRRATVAHARIINSDGLGPTFALVQKKFLTESALAPYKCKVAFNRTVESVEEERFTC